MKVGWIIDRREHDRKCWACKWVDAEILYPTDRQARALRMYERAVEQIEAMEGAFTRAEAWHRAGGGPLQYNAFGWAIHDLRMHGLLVCVRRSVSRCLTWQVVR